ncbi:7-cyano-7-deazaguanine synthase QueC [Anaeromicropila populeti]|uniref:7-cyano-7-deazaguanine synthase n=1 Tax=Anaeromicropila populeti TaxID=37658 RepID=A0A1I6JM03_9FIRM|nr:7-cyano-7-deazaguanine synthase QueC [Anaeromicropila populeti]SFR79967.1 7-cyano-7-deazaguanine synthase [Anaeromicropila populeti]
MKAMVLFSGGLDSTTCLALAIQRFGADHVIPLSIYYGQKHTKELEAARQVLTHYKIEGLEIDLTKMFSFSNCSLLQHSDEQIPEQSYEEQLKNSNGSPVTTYVPFRNGLFLSAAACIALSKDCSYIYYGAHRDDAAGNAYPDCSSSFHDAMSTAIYEGSGKALQLIAPFVGMTKADVVQIGLSLHVPYELTWSCYEGNEKACGKCGTCRDRIQAFLKNNYTDPILYDAQ